ncbi:MAG: hypothetical protein WC924_02615 [Candidatus Gracilibacteria bacterium]
MKATEAPKTTSENFKTPSRKTFPLFQYGALALLALSANDQKPLFDPSDLAGELAPYAEGMDPTVRKSFEEVLALMRTDLKGIIVEKSTFGGEGAVSASSKIPRKYEEKNSLIAVTLREDWDSSNYLDLALLVHELEHIVRIESERKAADKVTWTKRFGHTTAVEIRTELEPWELNLNLMDQLSEGLLSEFYENVAAADEKGAESLLKTYTQKIAVALNIRPNQKSVLKKMLQFYFIYRVQKENIGCAWSYSFVTAIANDYASQGVPLYELTLNSAEEGPDPTRCVYPLPGGTYDYKSYRPYEDIGKGLIGPSPKSVAFGF